MKNPHWPEFDSLEFGDTWTRYRRILGEPEEDTWAARYDTIMTHRKYPKKPSDALITLLQVVSERIETPELTEESPIQMWLKTMINSATIALIPKGKNTTFSRIYYHRKRVKLATKTSFGIIFRNMR